MILLIYYGNWWQISSNLGYLIKYLSRLLVLERLDDGQTQTASCLNFVAFAINAIAVGSGHGDHVALCILLHQSIPQYP